MKSDGTRVYIAACAFELDVRQAEYLHKRAGDNITKISLW
jgi:hypothetical protein